MVAVTVEQMLTKAGTHDALDRTRA